MFRCFIALLLPFFISTSAFSVDLSSAQMREIDKKIAAVVKKKDIVGISYAVIDKQGIVHANALGYRHKSEKAPATIHSAFAAGSISKSFTAVGIMQLIEQGKVDLDAPVSRYIKEFSLLPRYDVQEYTIRRFLTHSAGIPSDNLYGITGEDPISKDELIKRMQSQHQTLPPGKIYQYSNIGYTVLGLVIERVTGRSFEEYMQTEILAPLKMSNSSFDIDYIQSEEHICKGYNKKGKEHDYYESREVPAGGLLTSANDLAHYAQMYLNGGVYKGQQVLFKQSIQNMWTVQNSDVALDYDFKTGLCWRNTPKAGVSIIDVVPIWWHSGSTVLFCSQLIFFPEQEMAVLVLCNTRKCGTTKAIANMIAEAVLEEQFNIEVPSIKSSQKVKKLSTEDLENMPGEYATMWGKLTIERKGKDKLKASLIDKGFKVIAYENGEIGIRLQILGIPVKISQLEKLRLKFDNSTGEDVLVFVQNGKQYYFGVKYKPEPPTELWKKRLGNYEQLDPREGDVKFLYDFKVEQKGNTIHLQFKPKLYERFALQMSVRPINEYQAVLEGYSRWQGEVVTFMETEKGLQLDFLGLSWLKK